MEIFKKSSSLNEYIKSGNFKNKHIIITGCTGAIGSEVLYRFLKCDSKVVAFYNKGNPNIQELDSYINSKKLLFIQLDFEKITTKITDKFKEAITFLEGILDILIFCHGKFFQGDFRTVKTINFDKNININVRSNLHFLSLAVPFMKVQNSALELASFGIRINAVAPSFVESDFRKEAMSEEMNIKYLNQMKGFHLLNKKIMEPGEVADVIMFLASKDAGFMTGEIVNIDCGFELNHDSSFMVKDEIEQDNFLQNNEENNINNINNNNFY